MTNEINIRKVTAIEEIQAMQILEKKIWGMEPIPIHQTVTAVKNGGLIIGAYIGERMIGYSYSFAGFAEGQCYLCSHMLAVDEEFQLMGIGKRLKDEQLREARIMGYELIVWTFDPLESRNAYLNTSKLYGVCYDYIVNCYGKMDDGLNKGLPTDRFQIAWCINSLRVKERWQPSSLEFTALCMVNVTAEGFPVIQLPTDKDWLAAEAVEVPVPKHIQLMKAQQPELAYDWRLKTREVFQQLCDAGFALIDVRRTEETVQYYRFYKRSSIPLASTKEPRK